MFYRGVLHSFVVPMLYPLKVKSPYITHIQALKILMCDPERSRTPNLLIRSQTLYPIELRDPVDIRFTINDCKF